MTYTADELFRNGGSYWFCLRAQPKREHIAAASLRQVEGVEIFAPGIRFRKATRRGPVWFREALFPGYVFARFLFSAMHRQVRAVPGINGLVQFGERIATVDEASMARLAVAAGETQEIVFDPEFAPGDLVQITDGPFQGLEAAVVRLVPSRERVQILLNFLGRQVEAEVGRRALISAAQPRVLP